ncbi:hypothetical protein MMC26_001610 [Xylographa opegraphella]|nr:hypothetical protein [Xylographa opegraphella]
MSGKLPTHRPLLAIIKYRLRPDQNHTPNEKLLFFDYHYVAKRVYGIFAGAETRDSQEPEDWDGKYAIRAELESNIMEIAAKVPLVDAMVGLHLSQLAVPKHVETLVVPVSYGWAFEDVAVNIEQEARVEEIRSKARKAGRKVPEMEHKFYMPGRHGFAVRGNPDDPLERACLEDSVTQALNWFERWF